MVIGNKAQATDIKRNYASININKYQIYYIISDIYYYIYMCATTT